MVPVAATAGPLPSQLGATNPADTRLQAHTVSTGDDRQFDAFPNGQFHFWIEAIGGGTECASSISCKVLDEKIVRGLMGVVNNPVISCFRGSPCSWV